MRNIPKNHYFIMNKFTLLSLAKNTDTYKGCVWTGKLHKGFTDIVPQWCHQEPHATNNTWTTLLSNDAGATMAKELATTCSYATWDLTRKLSWGGEETGGML